MCRSAMTKISERRRDFTGPGGVNDCEAEGRACIRTCLFAIIRYCIYNKGEVHHCNCGAFTVLKVVLIVSLITS